MAPGALLEGGLRLAADLPRITLPLEKEEDPAPADVGRGHPHLPRVVLARRAFPGAPPPGPCAVPWSSLETGTSSGISKERFGPRPLE
jgi:hypothetical protein